MSCGQKTQPELMQLPRLERYLLQVIRTFTGDIQS